jgi:hypothetical protein
MDKDTAAFRRFLEKLIGPRHLPDEPSVETDDVCIEELVRGVRAMKHSLRKAEKPPKAQRFQGGAL